MKYVVSLTWTCIIRIYLCILLLCLFWLDNCFYVLLIHNLIFMNLSRKIVSQNHRQHTIHLHCIVALILSIDCDRKCPLIDKFHMWLLMIAFYFFFILCSLLQINIYIFVNVGCSHMLCHSYINTYPS